MAPRGRPHLPGDDDVARAQKKQQNKNKSIPVAIHTDVDKDAESALARMEKAKMTGTRDSLYSEIMPWIEARGRGPLNAQTLADLASHPADGTTLVDEPYDLGAMFPARVIRHMENFRAGRLEKPEQALDTHLDYWRWCASAPHEKASAAFLAAYYGTDADDMPDDVSRLFAEQESRDVYEAVTHYVDPDVADVVRQMGQAMPPDKLFPTDIPVPNGFAVLGSVWPYMNIDREEGYLGDLPIRAISWREAQIAQPVRADEEVPDEELFKPGIYVSLYVDSDWLVWDAVDYPAGGDKGSKPPLWLMDLWGWTYDTWWQDIDPEADQEQTDQHHQVAHVGEMRRMILALFRFMADEIIYTGRQRMPRPALRRWGRTKKKVPADGSIVTVHLRRIVKPQTTELEKDKTGQASKIEWSHRWWVRGHNRYNHKTQQKDIWVRPYLKGPEGLPIIIKEKLISVDR